MSYTEISLSTLKQSNKEVIAAIRIHTYSNKVAMW